MRYVIPILTLLFAVVSSADASVPPEVAIYCDSDCASYSTDVECDVEGVCAETYDQCYSRCVIPGGSSSPASSDSGVQCTPEGIIMWKEDMVIREPGGWWRYRFRWVKLERCGALHYLSFSEWRNHLVLPQ